MIFFSEGTCPQLFNRCNVWLWYVTFGNTKKIALILWCRILGDGNRLLSIYIVAGLFCVARLRLYTALQSYFTAKPFFTKIFSIKEEVYDAVCSPLVGDTLRGIAGAVFAYGATGAGKTHTMTGLMSRALSHLFTSISESDDPKAYEVSVRFDIVFFL